MINTGARMGVDSGLADPKNYKIKEPHIGVSKGALEALQETENYIQGSSRR